MTPGIREHRQSSCVIGIPLGLPDHMRSGIREVLNVISKSQRRGEATALLQQVCDEADRSGHILILKPVPFAEGLDAEQLERFYGKFGFVTTQEEPDRLMVRPPPGFNAAAQVLPEANTVTLAVNDAGEVVI
jgi:hypothetical protein